MKLTIQDEWGELGNFCWGCGKNNEYGLQLKSYWDEEEVIATFTPREHHLGFPGILNGGIIATIIDCHGTGTANAYGHRIAGSESSNHFVYVTASLHVNFIRPTPLDKPVTLRAKVETVDGNRITVSCSLYSEETLCATGEVLSVRVTTEKFVGN